MEIVKLLLEYPGSGVVMLISGVSFIFYLGVIYNKLKLLQDSIVTKTDLELALLKFAEKMHETFVTQEDCDKVHEA